MTQGASAGACPTAWIMGGFTRVVMSNRAVADCATAFDGKPEESDSSWRRSRRRRNGRKRRRKGFILITDLTSTTYKTRSEWVVLISLSNPTIW